MRTILNPLTISPLIDASKLSDRVHAMAGDLAASLPTNDDSVIFVSLLRGSFVFFADLFRAVNLPFARVDFMVVSSYGNASTSSGTVRIIKDLDTDIEGKIVILVDDIIDTGLTLHHILALLETRNPRKLIVCTLLDKPSRRIMPITLDYVGFSIDDVFVVGYGIDYAESYRCLPYIAHVSTYPLKEVS